MKTARVGKLLVADSLLISCGLVCKVSLLKCLLEYYTICLARIGIGIGIGIYISIEYSR